MFVWLKKDEEIVKKKKYEFETDVYCRECGVKILALKAKKVKERHIWQTSFYYYCQAHAPAYNIRVLKQGNLGVFFSATPYLQTGNEYIYLEEEMEVDIHGEPIGDEKNKA